MAEHMSLGIEIKTDGDKGTFAGTLSTYDNVDAAGDICVRGCYAKDVALNGTKRPLLWQHNPTEPIGSFEIVDTEEALRIAGRFNLDTAKGREAYALVKNGDISGLSIGYSTEVSSYDKEGHRLLQELKLYEGSVVTFPCNSAATVTGVKGDTTSMSAEDIAELEKRLKACEDELAAMKAEKDEDAEDEGEEKEDPEETEVPGDDADEEGRKALAAAIEHMTATINRKD